MYDSKDIILAVDYHDENFVIRQFNCHTGQERLLKYRTTSRNIRKVVSESVNEAAEVGGQVFWIMESTTGWTRVKEAIGSLATMLVATRESLVSRRTALRNWINRYLAHETWRSRAGLWSSKGMRSLKRFAASVEGPDKVVLLVKLRELEHLEELQNGLGVVDCGSEQYPEAFEYRFSDAVKIRPSAREGNKPRQS